MDCRPDLHKSRGHSPEPLAHDSGEEPAESPAHAPSSPIYSSTTSRSHSLEDHPISPQGPSSSPVSSPSCPSSVSPADLPEDSLAAVSHEALIPSAASFIAARADSVQARDTSLWYSPSPYRSRARSPAGQCNADCTDSLRAHSAADQHNTDGTDSFHVRLAAEDFTISTHSADSLPARSVSQRTANIHSAHRLPASSALDPRPADFARYGYGEDGEGGEYGEPGYSSRHGDGGEMGEGDEHDYIGNGAGADVGVAIGRSILLGSAAKRKHVAVADPLEIIQPSKLSGCSEGAAGILGH